MTNISRKKKWVSPAATVPEGPDDRVFLHRGAAGAAGKSDGLHAARLAGVPPRVVERAAEVLAGLEQPAPARKPDAVSAAVDWAEARKAS